MANVITSKQFVLDIIHEMRDVLDLMEDHTDSGNHMKPEGRVTMEELKDLARILCNPSLTHKTAMTTTNGFIYDNFRNLKLEDLPDLIQVSMDDDDNDGNRQIITTIFNDCSKVLENIGKRERDTEDDGCVESFVMNDLVGFMADENINMPERICEIRSCYVIPDERRQGKGSQAIKDTIEKFGMDQLYCITNYVYSADHPHPERVEDEIRKKVMEENDTFLKANNFININKWVGYEYKEAYLYIGNEIGKIIYKALREKAFVSEPMEWKCTICNETHSESEWDQMTYDDICDTCIPAAKAKGIIEV